MIRRLGNYALLGPALVAVILLGALTANRGLHEAALEADYMAFLTAGKLVAVGYGNADMLYDRTLQASTQQALLAGSDISIPGGLLPFANPPFAALPFVPLAYLPIGTGFLLWDALQLAALLLALWLLRPLLPIHHRYLLWLSATIFIPFNISIQQGQFSPLLLLSVTMLWWGLQRGGLAEWWGGAALGLLLLKPQLLPVFVLYLLYKGKGHALAGFALAGMGLYLLSALLAGFAWPGPYLTMLAWFSGFLDQLGAIRVMPVLRGALSTLGLENGAILLMLTLLLFALFIYTCWRSDITQRDDAATTVGRLELQLAAATLISVMTSLHLYLYDTTILLFSVAVLLGWGASHDWPRWVVALLLLNLAVPFLNYVASPPIIVIFATYVVTLVELLYLLRQSQSASAGIAHSPISASLH
jgi:Glycosyltransferase family 87